MTRQDWRQLISGAVGLMVDGPGYGGPHGWSIMSDYRDQLTMGDLIDLVAYLQSL